MADLAATGHVAVDSNDNPAAAAADGAKRTEQQLASPGKPCSHVAINVDELARVVEPQPPPAEECAVCMEPLEFVAIGPCGHTSVCSRCALRIRASSRGDTMRVCCICRAPCPVVVVTRAGRPPSAANAVHARLPRLGAYQGPVGDYWYHSTSAAYFDDQRQYEAACSAAAGDESKDDGGGGVGVGAGAGGGFAGARAVAWPPAWWNPNVAFAVSCLAVTGGMMGVLIFGGRWLCPDDRLC